MIPVIAVPAKSLKSAMGSKENFIQEIETIIIGGGQAGLSVGRYLKEAGRPFLILDKGLSVGWSWENRYDSLVLDSFAKYSFLEGFPFWGDPMRQVKKDEVIQYLRAFAKHYDLRPQFSTEVLKVSKKSSEFIIETNRGIYRSKFVVLATGAFHKPFIPKNAEKIALEIYQIHSSAYRNPKELKEGAVLVVGGGNSGAEIAKELLESGREVLFSFKGKFRSIRNSHLSQWLAYWLGLAHVPVKSLLGKIIIWHTKGKAVGEDVKFLLKNPKLTCVGEFKGKVPKSVSNIIWATGYQSDFSIVSIPDFDPRTQERGVTNIKGLYLLNIRWQYSKSSSHLAGVSRDAKYIARHICNNVL